MWDRCDPALPAARITARTDSDSSTPSSERRKAKSTFAERLITGSPVARTSTGG